jgi:hypothetical protein
MSASTRVVSYDKKKGGRVHTCVERSTRMEIGFLGIPFWGGGVAAQVFGATLPGFEKKTIARTELN